jgi:hypothetical protein
MFRSFSNQVALKTPFRRDKHDEALPLPSTGQAEDLVAELGADAVEADHGG